MGGTVAGEVGVPVCEGKFLQGDLSMVNRHLGCACAYCHRSFLRLKFFKQFKLQLFRHSP